jgi:hypothetical protein
MAELDKGIARRVKVSVERFAAPVVVQIPKQET